MRAKARWLLMTALILGATSAWAVPSVKLVASPFQRPGAGADVVVAVAASQTDGVTAMDLAYTFDPSVLTPKGVFRTGYTGGFLLEPNITTPGVVNIHLGGSTAISGSGEVAWVLFRIAPGVAAGTNTPLSWVYANLNGGAIPCTSQGAMLVVGSASSRFSAPQNAFGARGTQVSVPISASALAGGSSLDLIVTFDPNVLAAVSVQKSTLTSCMNVTANLSVPGTVRISMFGLCTVSGSGPLVYVVFNVVGASGSRTPLNVTRGTVDEDRYPTVLQDGLFNVCGTPDADGDGYSACAGDCNDASPAVHPGALEVCNGVDDDCNSVVDDAVTAAPIVGLVLAGEYGDTRLTWPVTAGATGYDVVRGDVSALRLSDGNFSSSTDTCLVDNGPASNVLDSAIPTDDGGFWYLVRPVNCGGPGSFDGAGTHQIALRDPGINAAPSSCP